MQKLSMMMENNPQWQRLKIRYELLSGRNRRALQLSSVALTIFLMYLLVWEPFSYWVDNKKGDYVHQQDIHDWFEKNKGRALELQKNQKAIGGQRELSSVVSVSARQAGLTLNRVQPDRKGLSVWIEDVAYQKLVKWLILLENKSEVMVQQIRLDKLKEEGRVKGYIHLVN